MKRTIHAVRGALRSRRGITALVAAASMVVIVGMAGFVVDLGHAFAVQRALQASADAAALAGAQDINCCADAPNQAISTAIAYSGVAGGRNASPKLTVTMVAGYPALKCFKSTGVACTGSSAANGIVVKEQSTVPMWFASVLGIKATQVSVTATAGISGGLPKPLNVMLVLDTTASMNDPDPSCSIKGATRLDCALAGVQMLLTTLAPSDDKIGLMTFPGLQSASQAQYDYDCSSRTTPKIAAYSASPVYQIVPLSSNYRTSNAATGLNPSSDLALASGGVSGCATGMQAVGGVGTYYAAAITAAQAALTSTGQPGAQNVIILLSDGDANASASNMPAGQAKNQCHEAIAAAHTAAADGTWVYAIAYGSPTAPTPGSCSTDSPAISACSTMQQIASDPTKFYSDTVGGASACTSAAQPVSELVSLFQSIAYSLVPPRLLPNDVD